MSDSTFNIERATNGLVLALFLAAALFLGIMLYHVLQDIETRTSEPKEEGQAHVVPPSWSPSVFSPRPQRVSLLCPDSETNGLVVHRKQVHPPLVRSRIHSRIHPPTAHCVLPSAHCAG